MTVTIAAANEVVAGVLEGGFLGLPVVRPLVFELATADLEAHLVVDHAVPAGLVGVAPVFLPPGRSLGLVAGDQRRNDVGIQPVRLQLLAALRIASDPPNV